MTLLVPTLLIALTSAAEPPVVGRPRDFFYGAAGERVAVAMRVSRTTVRAEDSLILTLIVTGLTNPEKVERPDLRQLPEFAERFHIDDLPDEGPVGTSRTFRYRLRPRNERVRDVPPMLFHYWNPRWNYFATTATREPIELEVQPRTPAASAAVPMDEPDFLFELPADAVLHRRPLSDDARLALQLLAVLLPPLGFQFWLLYWRWRYPSAAKLAYLRRTRAVREALDALTGLTGAPDDADRVAAAVRGLLRERVGLPAHVATPAEITAGLAARSMPQDLVAKAEQFFLDCDAARFGPPASHDGALAASAKDLILAVEDAA